MVLPLMCCHLLRNSGSSIRSSADWPPSPKLLWGASGFPRSLEAEASFQEPLQSEAQSAECGSWCQDALPRMVGPDIIPLPHIYGARIKGVEVFCPLDPPPPYEAVVSQMDQEQVLFRVSAFCTLTASRPRGSLRGDGLLIILRSSLGMSSELNTSKITLSFPVMQGSSFQIPEGSAAAASPLEPVCTQVTQGNRHIPSAQSHDLVD